MNLFLAMPNISYPYLISQRISVYFIYQLISLINFPSCNEYEIVVKKITFSLPTCTESVELITHSFNLCHILISPLLIEYFNLAHSLPHENLSHSFHNLTHNLYNIDYNPHSNLCPEIHTIFSCGYFVSDGNHNLV